MKLLFLCLAAFGAMLAFIRWGGPFFHLETQCRRLPLWQGGCFVLVCLLLFSQPETAPRPLLCALFLVLIPAGFEDARRHIIPNRLVLLGLALALPALAWDVSRIGFAQAVAFYGLGFLAGLLPLGLLSYFFPAAMGPGDAKLMAVAGCFLGLRQALLATALAFVAAGLFAAGGLLLRRLERRSKIAFAPWLTIGVLGALYYDRVVRLLP